MRIHLILGLATASITVLGAFAGCTVPVDSGTSDEETAATTEPSSTRQDAFYTVRRDTRPHVGRTCAGYLIKEVNERTAQRCVDWLKFRTPALLEQAMGTDHAIPDGGVIVRGYIGKAEGHFNLVPLVVTEAYRGLPGVSPDTGDVYFRIDADQYVCMNPPCWMFKADRLNTARVDGIDDVDVTHASLPHVDDAWLTDRVLHHGAVVTGRLTGAGHDFTGGPQGLDVSQVFLRIPEIAGPCLRIAHHCLDPYVPAYTRNADRCLVFDGCVERGGCPVFIQPPFSCPEGYTAETWRAKNWMCLDFACDPTFSVP
jgi:hypothetical protein